VITDWKKLALFLADCQAATTMRELSIKSGSKSEKRRHRDICQMAKDFMEGRDCFGSRDSDLVIDRLARALAEEGTPEVRSDSGKR
jgi:hypothetical protein